MRVFLSGLLLVVLVQRPASFDVATIKRAVPDAVGSSGEDGRNGVLKMWNVSLKRCIRYAYNIPEDQVLGGPKWIDELRYDILAKVDHSVDEPELLTMLQPLLAERFKLKLHHETRLMPGYILTVAKGGIKATVADPNRHSGGNGGRGFIDSRASQLSGLTIRLSALLERPVLDMTGDKRKFDFHLQWNPQDTLGGDAATSDSPSLTTALQEQLGLKLESRKVNADVLVVDRAELPSEN
ncbi:MAG TPA: TIGR03435 family protein [Terriglobia bacterium]|nr:TIGR03435 family protein [Terriglobia bacterium]